MPLADAALATGRTRRIDHHDHVDLTVDARASTAGTHATHGSSNQLLLCWRATVISPTRDSFRRDGFVIVRNLRDADFCQEALALVESSLHPPLAPVEFEADVGYPGAPTNREAPGGETPRRLLNAYARAQLFRDFAMSPDVAELLSELGEHDDWLLSQSHHNCVMTKHPGFSSETNWHQDIRYWSFDHPELISVWLALGDEHDSNGSLFVMPGTHVMEFDRGRLDADLFLRSDLRANADLIESARGVQLGQGDALFFHCRLFHAAGRNQTNSVKTSLVFTYHDVSNQPIPNTRSSRHESIRMPEPRG